MFCPLINKDCVEDCMFKMNSKDKHMSCKISNGFDELKQVSKNIESVKSELFDMTEQIMKLNRH